MPASTRTCAEKSARASTHRRGSRCGKPPSSSGLSEERIELAAGSCAGELIECAVLGDRSGGTHEPTPGRARKGTADADSPHAEGGYLVKGKFGRRPHEKVERLGCDGSDDGRDIVAHGNARRIEAIGAGVCISVEPRDGFVETGTIEKKAFGASHQKRIAAGLVDGFSRCAHSFACPAELEQGLGPA